MPRNIYLVYKHDEISENGSTCSTQHSVAIYLKLIFCITNILWLETTTTAVKKERKVTNRKPNKSRVNEISHQLGVSIRVKLAQHSNHTMSYMKCKKVG